MTVDLTDQYLRIRIRNPREFKPTSFRTQMIGHNRRIAAQLKWSGKRATQSILINRFDLAKRQPDAVKLLRNTKRQHKIKIPQYVTNKIKLQVI